MFAIISTLFLFCQLKLECNTKCFDFHYGKREKKKLIKKEIGERDFDSKIVIIGNIKKKL